MRSDTSNPGTKETTADENSADHQLARTYLRAVALHLERVGADSLTVGDWFVSRLRRMPNEIEGS